MAYFTCATALLIIVFSSEIVKVHVNQHNTIVPKIVLIDRHEIDNTGRSRLTVSCISETTNFWRWELEEYPTSKLITKHQLPQTDSNGKSYYVSNLTISNIFYGFRSNGYISVYLFCVTGVESKMIDWSTQLISCAEFKEHLPFHSRPGLNVYYGVTIKKCRQQRYGMQKPKQAISYCPTDLIIDLDGLRVACQRNQHNATVKTFKFSDLDALENFDFNYDQTYSVITGACNKARYEAISHYTSAYTDMKVLQHNISFPMNVYCQKTLGEWTSFVSLYPSFRIHGKKWSELTYYKKLDEARVYSMQLLVLSHGQQDFENIKISNQNERKKLTIGETVTFVCVALRYFYAAVPHFMIDKIPVRQDDVSNEKAEIDIFQSDDMYKYLYVEMRKIVMNDTKYGSVFNITCRALIWNSVEFHSYTKQVSLHPAKIPETSMICKENDTMVSCSCEYNGWPQPTITWHMSAFLNLTKTDVNIDSNDDNISYMKMTWTSHRIYTKPQFASALPVSVTCNATNFRGSDDSTYETEKTQKESVSSVRYPLFIGFTVLFVLLALLVAMGIYLRNVKKQLLLTQDEVNFFFKGQGRDETSELRNADYEDCSVLQFPMSYKIPKEYIEFGCLLGSGEFGMVRKGLLLDHGEVAIKVPNSCGDKRSFTSALAELKILCYLGSHSHVVSLIGAYVDEIMKGKVYIVLEYCENGSLIKYLRQKQQILDEFCVDLYEMCKFAHEIASGMEYIANKKVIHGDLAARNILLTNEFSCKIADFGLSRKLYTYSVYAKKGKEPLPWKWMAPESLKNMIFTTKSDMWSYGVTVWEIFSLGIQPYPGLSWTNVFVQELDNGMRLQKPQHCSDDVHSKLLDCFNMIPEHRPSFGDMANFFANLRASPYVPLGEN